MANANASAMKFLVVGDSHARCIPSPRFSGSFQVITKAVSGLKWINRYERNLCAKALLSSGEAGRWLSEADAVVFLTGTNSVRILSAEEVINQVKGMIASIREEHLHLNDPESIAIALTFPCLKLTKRFSTERRMMESIDSFSRSLRSLSSEISFSIIDFHLTVENRGRDRIHIHPADQHLIFDSTIDHFHRSAQARLNPITTSVNLDPPEVSSSTGVEDKPSQSAYRSREALNRENKKRYGKMKAKQQQHSIKRRISSKWTFSQLKKYLRSMNIRFGEIAPIANGVLQVKFNNQKDQDMAEAILGEDKFDKNHFEQFVQTEGEKS